MGEYQFATKLDRKALKESLKNRRVWEAASFLYDIMWNKKEQKANEGQQMGKEKMTEILQGCITLSHFCKQTFKVEFYKNKLR